jgi:CubicO group peptidase (beta-lactamase class C family)
MYSASDGIDVLARVVEIVSDMPLNRFLKQRIFDPLEMPDTSHYPTDSQMPRLVTAYRSTDEGLVETENSLSMSSRVYFAGGGGLVSTVDDYANFAQMLANGGEFNGQRLLSPRTVDLMSADLGPARKLLCNRMRHSLGGCDNLPEFNAYPKLCQPLQVLF